MKKSLLHLLFIPMLMWSCADDNSQIDEFMAANEANLQEQLQILNNQGEFYNFNLKILDGNDPIEGANVVLSSSKGGEIQEISATSDANGNVIFTNFTVGGNYITISKDNYYNVNGIINFKFEEGYNYEIVNGRVVPIERNETAILPLYSKEGNQNTAKISGKVTFERDLTNDEPEYPVGKTIRADFTSKSLQSSEGVSFNEYTVSADGLNLGSGTVQEDGTYELIVPAQASGSSIKLITPELRDTQKFAWYNNDLERYEYTEKEARYGENVDYNYVPYVPGAIAEISSPPESGEGFEIGELRKVGRKIFNDRTYIYTAESQETGNNTIYSFYGGNYYKSTPNLIITDPTGTGFEADIEMEAAVQNITITETGNYPPNSSVRADIYVNNNELGRFFRSFSINADANGNITQEIIDELFPSLENYYNEGFGDNYKAIDEFDNFTIYFSNSTAATDPVQAQGEVEYNARITALTTRDRGSNYTDPKFTFEGGGTASPAVLDFSYYGTRWGIPLINDITKPYIVEPLVKFQYVNRYGNISNNSYITNDSLAYGYSSFTTMNEELEIDENGAVVFRSGSPYYTDFYSEEEPVVIMELDKPQKASLRFVIDFETGEIIGNENFYSGIGYSEPFEVNIKPSIDGLPGEGAEISILGGSYNSRGEYQWSGLISIINKGSDYLYYLNSGERNFEINASREFTVSSGDEIYRDIYYGSGRRIYE